MIPLLKNELGFVTINKDVISRTAGSLAMECYGVVGMTSTSVKDGIVKLLKIENLSKGVKVNIEKSYVNIDLNIMVEYGMNISAISNSIIDVVKYNIEEFIGVKVGSVNIFVEAIRVQNN